MKAGIIFTGDELLEGFVQEQNLTVISTELSVIGYEVAEVCIVRDDIEQIVSTIKRMCRSCSLLILSGGLGPTFDDVTLEALSRAVDKPLQVDEQYLGQLKERFSKRYDRVLPENLTRQALVLQDSVPIDNLSGSARGLYYQSESGNDFLVMPGPPGELKDVMNNAIRIIRKPQSRIVSRSIRFVGITEAEINPFLESLRNHYPEIRMVTRADYAIGPTLFLTSSNSYEKHIREIVQEIRARFARYVFTTTGESFLGLLVDKMRGRSLSLSVAESCTGGVLSSAIVSVPGVSDVYLGGIVAYSNTSKQSVLGIPKDILNSDGAVSEKCAAMMAERVARLFASDIGLAVTGIAGPSGGTTKKPVGLVYSAIYAASYSEVYRTEYSGTRHTIMNKASYDLLKNLWRILQRI